MLRSILQKITCLFWLLSVWLCCAQAVGESVDPRQEDVRIEVRALALQGFIFTEHSMVDFAQVKQQLEQERAKFGLLMTVEQLNQLADAMTLFVRAKGFPFHSIYLPPQQVVDGQVQFMMQEGVLVDVQVINNTRWPDARFKKPFADLVGKLLYGPAVERRLFALKAQAGFKVFAFYSRGQRPGEARLNLRLEPATKRVTSLRFDNYGSRASGRYRATAQLQEHNVSGHFDELSLAILQTLDEVSNTYGSLTYQLPFAGLDWVWDINLSNNQFEVGANFAPLELAGTATSVSTGLSRYFNWQDGQRRWAGLEIFSKDSDLTSGLEQMLDQQETSKGVSLSWNQELAWGRTGVGFGVDATYGRFTREPQLAEAKTFNKLDYNLALGRAAGRFGLRPSLGLRGQWTNTALPSIENVSLTGAYGVRGLEAGLFAADRGWVLGAEVAAPELLPKGRNWRLEPYLYVDAAKGDKLSGAGNQPSSGQFAGVGVGLRAAVTSHLDAKVSASVPVGGDIDGVSIDKSGVLLLELRIH